MNLISQNCMSGYIYQLFLKQKFGNPFIWTVIDFASMYNLITMWDKINFRTIHVTKDAEMNYSVIVDGKVKVQYVHYKFDPDAKELSVDSDSSLGGNVRYCKIWEYIVEKFKERTERMLAKNERPIFCICNFKTIYNDAVYTEEQLKTLEQFDNVKILRGCENDQPLDAAKKYLEYLINESKS